MTPYDTALFLTVGIVSGIGPFFCQLTVAEAGGLISWSSRARSALAYHGFAGATDLMCCLTSCV
ncbi:hypothetical protein ABIE06_004677 [Pantoea dispersa]